jgi:ADP-ribose pyrophosphatase
LGVKSRFVIRDRRNGKQMQENPQSPWTAYLQLKQEEPELFENPAGGFQILFDPLEIEKVEPENANPWRKIGVQYRDPYFVFLRDAVRFPDGSIGAYSRVLLAPERTDGVAFLPVHQGKFLLLRQFRHATRRFHIEAPRGFGEPGKSPEENARRELYEELGLEAHKLTPLGPMFTDPGMTNIKVHLFRVETCGGNPRTDINEGIASIEAFTPDELKNAVAGGQITDAFTLALVARLMARDELGVS